MRKIHNCLLTNDLAVALLVEALNGKPDGKHREGRGRAPPHMVETGVKCIPLKPNSYESEEGRFQNEKGRLMRTAGGKGKAPAVRRERKRDYAGACSAKSIVNEY